MQLCLGMDLALEMSSSSVKTPETTEPIFHRISWSVYHPRIDALPSVSVSPRLNWTPPSLPGGSPAGPQADS